MMFECGVLDEEITIYGQSDHVCSEVVGSWGNGCGAVAGAQREHCDAVSGHTVAMPGQKAGEDPTLAVCWDADRMDIGRVGKIVDPDYLFTGMAKELVLLRQEAEEF